MSPDRLAQQFDLATRDLLRPAGGVLRFCAIEGVDLRALPADLQRAAPRRQRTYAAGREAASKALQAAGLGVQVWPGRGADLLPIWPEGWQGSISHTDDLATAIVRPHHGRLAPLGLDLERIMDTKTAQDVAPDIAPELLPVLPASDQNLTITRAFSAKEALYKALYPITRGFQGFDAAQVSLGATAAHLRLAWDWGPGWPAGAVLTARQIILEGHVLSVISPEA